MHVLQADVISRGTLMHLNYLKALKKPLGEFHMELLQGHHHILKEVLLLILQIWAKRGHGSILSLQESALNLDLEDKTKCTLMILSYIVISYIWSS